MRKKFNEQIDYGDRPERMDPYLVQKLVSPENLYASNPALRGGSEDVQKLVSKRFQKVAQKLSQVTGIEDLSSQQVQLMVYQEMMRKVPNIMSIEARHKDELIQLAIEASLDETETPEGWYQIEANLGMPDASNFRFEPEEDEEEEEDEENKPSFPSFDIEDLTDEEILELEKHKRQIIRAIVQGKAKKSHYLFQKPEIKARLDAINPSLYNDYLGIMAINDFLYFSMEQMIEMMSQTGQGVAGKVEVTNTDEGDEGEGGEDQPNTKIIATGLIFPILCHEIIKGLEDAIARYGLPQDKSLAKKVIGQTDILSNEPMQLRIGPEIVERIRFALPDEMFDPDNKGLMTWFHILLYQIEAQEFLEIIGNAISDDKSKVKLATNRFKEIVKEAMVMKQQFEDYKESQGSESEDADSNDDDDDMLDDFLSDLGIPRAPRN
jgi:hypothetical protein